MYQGKKILAVIPARGNSKGIPRKNMKKIAGRPLFLWTVDAAKNCSLIDKIIVSTEDKNIAKAAGNAGVPTYDLRPLSLATDTVTTNEVLLYELSKLENSGEKFEIIVKLQPTSPFRTSVDIKQSIELLHSSGYSSIVSVCQAETHPWWMNTLPPNNNMANFIRPDVVTSTRQNLPCSYRLNGAIYTAFTEFFKKNNSFFSESTGAYIMPQERSVDIDTEFQFHLADLLLKELKSRGKRHKSKV